MPNLSKQSNCRVLVLQDGWYKLKYDGLPLEISESVIKALKSLGHNVEVFNPPRDLQAILKGISNSFNGCGPEVIFNAMHGSETQDGTFQGVLELLGIPYTFSGVGTSAIAGHKGVCRAVMKDSGVTCPPGAVISLLEYKHNGWSYPHVVKPLTEGGSVDISFVENDDVRNNVISSWSYGEELLVEDYIPGREITVAVFGGKAMGAFETSFPGPIFDSQSKNNKYRLKRTVAPELPPDVSEQLFYFAEQAHRILGCSGVSRHDFRYNPDAPIGSQVYFLETNPTPDLGENAALSCIAQHCGWSYEDIIAYVLDQAFKTRS